MPGFNEYQRQAIVSGFRDVHHRLADLESMLAQSLTESSFFQYVNDLAPTERKVIQDYFGRIREAMRRLLYDAGITLEVRQTSLRWALRGGLIFLDSDVSELTPNRLTGYGVLGEEARTQAERIQHELHHLIDRAAVYLREGLGRDLGQRLARLDASDADAGQLLLLDGILTRHGLVEFRPLLDQIVRRMEEPRFEIAVFGRVSSGKSSLLNHVAGCDILPVGVVPITAVPTRLRRGEPARVDVTFAEWQPRTVGIDHLREYASEEGNPRNREHVTSIEVFTPSPRLREGVVLVDTPGIGSLARTGSAETIAYLPRCDLGVVLLDAATNLNDDDLNLVRLLVEAAVPFQVLLSKADLLTPAQQRQAVEYARTQIRQELELEVTVHPVSIVGDAEKLLHQWFEREIEPLLARSRILAEQSLRRKTALLSESVLATLEATVSRKKGTANRASTTSSPLSLLLESADRAIHAARERCRDWTTDETALIDSIFNRAAKQLLSPSFASKPGVIGDVAQEVLAGRGQQARLLLVGLQETLGRTLESLRQVDPSIPTDVSAVRTMTFRGLPSPELSPLERATDVTAPWWGELLPSLAAGTARRQIAQTLGPELREQIDLRDRQFQAWLRQSLAALIETYENQSEIFRTRARSADGPATDEDSEADADTLEAELRELRQLRASEPSPREGPSRSAEMLGQEAGGCGTLPS